MTLATGVVSADSLSEGWLRTLDTVNGARERKLFHTVTRISDPTREDPAIRAMAERLAADHHYASVNTVANTIFPAALAAASADHEEFAARYVAMYPRIRRIHQNNSRGTYFGRLVAHPNGSSTPVNQLASTISKLRAEAAKLGEQSRQGPKSARYELSIEVASDTTSAEDSAEEETGVALPSLQTYAAGRDNNIMAFPCLSFCSLQLDQGLLHLAAQYRAQSLVERGYGNYLGLARLQQYVASQAEVAVGGLMIIAGRADALGSSKFKIRSSRGSAPSS